MKKSNPLKTFHDSFDKRVKTLQKAQMGMTKVQGPVTESTAKDAGEMEFDLNKPDGTPRKLLAVSRLNGLGGRGFRWITGSPRPMRGFWGMKGDGGVEFADSIREKRQ